MSLPLHRFVMSRGTARGLIFLQEKNSMMRRTFGFVALTTVVKTDAAEAHNQINLFEHPDVTMASHQNQNPSPAVSVNRRRIP